MNLCEVCCVSTAVGIFVFRLLQLKRSGRIGSKAALALACYRVFFKKIVSNGNLLSVGFSWR